MPVLNASHQGGDRLNPSYDWSWTDRAMLWQRGRLQLNFYEPQRKWYVGDKDGELDLYRVRRSTRLRLAWGLPWVSRALPYANSCMLHALAERPCKSWLPNTR